MTGTKVAIHQDWFVSCLAGHTHTQFSTSGPANIEHSYHVTTAQRSIKRTVRRKIQRAACPHLLSFACVCLLLQLSNVAAPPLNLFLLLGLCASCLDAVIAAERQVTNVRNVGTQVMSEMWEHKSQMSEMWVARVGHGCRHVIECMVRACGFGMR